MLCNTMTLATDTGVLPLIKNDRGYEFQLFCPWYDCEKGILFCRNLINESIPCPCCKKDVLLNLADVQEIGLDHIKKLKKMAMRLWLKTDKSPGTWNGCIKYVLRNHRIRLLKIDTYDAYRPRAGWPKEVD